MKDLTCFDLERGRFQVSFYWRGGWLAKANGGSIRKYWNALGFRY